MKREKILKLLGLFLLFMLVCTILSRAADSFSVAQVSAETMENQVITHQVKGNGKVKGTKEQAVFTQAEQKVEKIWVQEGQKVKKGDVLFQVDQTVLEEGIWQQESEKKKLEASNRAAQKNKQIQEQKQQIDYERAQEDYQEAEENGEIDIANAQQEVDLAYEKLEEFYARQETENQEDIQEDENTADTGAQEEDALLEEIRTKEEALNQMVEKRNEEVQTAQRAMEDAQLPQNEDSTEETNQQEILQIERKLEKLQALKTRKGKVVSPADGVISAINVKAGSQTTEEAALLLAVSQGGCQFVMQIDKDDRKYVEVGSEASITADNGQKEIKEAKVEQIQQNTEDSSLLDVFLSVPKGEMEIGDTGEAVIVKDSRAYQTCIPLSALNEEQGQYFVYVTEEQDTVLGTELTARKVSVTVAEKNETYAALTEGSLTSDQKVITDSNKEIEGGSRVRLKEE